MYEEHTLAGGRVVGMRPLGWDEYWTLQKDYLSARKDLLERAKMMPDVEYTLELGTVERERRERPLALCVREWGTLMPELSMPEVVEIEETLKRISHIGILSGNSAPAAAAVPAAEANTAANA